MLTRRALGGALVALAAPALAQDAWPTRPIRLIIPFAPGGPIDTVGRLVSERLREKLGQPFVIDNRAGAGGSIGLRATVQAPPDGATFVLTSSSLAILPAIYANLGFDPRTDLTPVSLVAEIATTIAVRADHRFGSLQALVAEARAKPGTITYGTSGIGSSNHLSGAMLAATAGIDLVHVPYRGAAQAMNALYTGDIDVVFASTVETLAHARDGRARILAVTTQQRIPALPDVPTALEIGAGLCRAELVRDRRAQGIAGADPGAPVRRAGGTAHRPRLPRPLRNPWRRTADEQPRDPRRAPRGGRADLASRGGRGRNPRRMTH